MASLINPSLVRQVRSYVGIGLVATALHYCVLVALVQIFRVPPVAATLCGYLCGGLVSYSLNRRHTFASDRPHDEAVWRFVAVAAVGFGLTYVLMRQFVDLWHAPYLPAQIVTTGMVMFWTFAANRLWTFRGAAEG